MDIPKRQYNFRSALRGSSTHPDGIVIEVWWPTGGEKSKVWVRYANPEGETMGKAFQVFPDELTLIEPELGPLTITVERTVQDTFNLSPAMSATVEHLSGDGFMLYGYSGRRVIIEFMLRRNPQSIGDLTFDQLVEHIVALTQTRIRERHDARESK